ncbi:M15 family metallopeptidase [Stenotrophomonas rhizophila]|nr:M15 family metallopeptidase [Stenotrophomonas rhizophila]
MKHVLLILVLLGITSCATVHGGKGKQFRQSQQQSQKVLRSVHPSLSDKLQEVYAVMQSNGYDMRALEGHRSEKRQAALLASNTGVTTVGAGRSCHNYRLAVDSVVYVDGKPSWDLNNAHVRDGYMLYGKLVQAVGLEWGGAWKTLKDYPHAEMHDECVASVRARKELNFNYVAVDSSELLKKYRPMSISTEGIQFCKHTGVINESLQPPVWAGAQYNCSNSSGSVLEYSVSGYGCSVYRNVCDSWGTWSRAYSISSNTCVRTSHVVSGGTQFAFNRSPVPQRGVRIS